MNTFVVKIAARYVRLTVTLWAIAVFCDLIVSKLYGSDTPRILTSVICVLFSTLLASGLMNQSRWVDLWRRKSRNVRNFWAVIAFVLLLNLLANVGAYFLTTRFLGRTDELFSAMSAVEVLVVLILVYTFSLISVFDPRMLLERQKMRPARQLFGMMGVFIWLFIFFPLFVYSRLLGYSFLEVSLLCWFFLKNGFLKFSVRRVVRTRMLLVSLAVLLLLTTTVYQIEVRKPDHAFGLLGFLVPKKEWLFTNLETIDRPSEWVNWVKHSKNLSTEELIASLAKLQEICPAQPSDSPSIIQCLEARADYSNSMIPNERTGGETTEDQIHQLLASPLEYSQLTGLMLARGLSGFSSELKRKIENIGNTPGNLSPVAQVTMETHSATSRNRVRIIIRDSFAK